MPISITRFGADQAVLQLNKLGLKVGIIHLVNLKPLKLEKHWIDSIKSSKYGVLMTDNDYVDGILRILAHKINEKTEKKVYVIGLKNKSAGHTEATDNLPPNCADIVQKVKEIIKTNKIS